VQPKDDTQRWCSIPKSSTEMGNVLWNARTFTFFLILILGKQNYLTRDSWFPSYISLTHLVAVLLPSSLPLAPHLDKEWYRSLMIWLRNQKLERHLNVCIRKASFPLYMACEGAGPFTADSARLLKSDTSSNSWLLCALRSYLNTTIPSLSSPHASTSNFHSKSHP
jgi:hypothetical protein